MFSFQGLGKVEKEKVAFFFLACLSLFAGQRNCVIWKGNDVFFPPALPSVQLEPGGVDVPGLLLTKACVGSHMSLHLRRIAVF